MARRSLDPRRTQYPRVLHAQGCEQTAVKEIVEVCSRHLFRQGPEYIGMKAVNPFLAGLGQQRISGQLVDHVLKGVLERQNLPLLDADAGGPADGIAKTGGVIEQVPDGHGRVLRHGAHDLVAAQFRDHRHGGDFRQVIGNGVVQTHGPVVHQGEDGGARDRPALGIDPEHGVRLHRKACFAVAVSVRFQLHELAVLWPRPTRRLRGGLRPPERAWTPPARPYQTPSSPHRRVGHAAGSPAQKRSPLQARWPGRRRRSRVS